MQKILSVIIPSYNITKYIDKTMNSFLTAKSVLDKVEILIVNDGSTDETPIIGAEYEKKYPGIIRLVNKENGGHGSTINKGIEEATGKYFKVVDGDDWVDSQNFVQFVEFLEETDADMILSPYDTFDENTQKQEKNTFMEPFAGVRAFDDVCGDMEKISIHGFIVKTEILRDNHIRIDEKMFYVDVEYVFYPLPYVNTVAYLDASMIVYRIGTNEQSMNVKNLWIRREQHRKVVQSLLDFYGKLDTTPAKKEYLRKSIGKVAEGQYRIYFVGPLEANTKEELLVFDRELKEASPEIYDGVSMMLLKIVRKFGFPFFGLMSAIYQKK